MNKQKIIKYFAYGSNLNFNHLKKRCPRSEFLRPGKLNDYELKFLYKSTSFEGGGAADIVPNDDSFVWGVVYSMYETDLLELDKYEDVATSGYQRLKVNVVTKLGNEKAVSYSVVKKLKVEIAPTTEYSNLMLSGAKSYGLPSDYCELIAEKIKVLREHSSSSLST